MNASRLQVHTYATRSEHAQAVRHALEPLLKETRVRVLEAGGGERTRVSYLAGAEFTAIDISPEQLKRNVYAANKILGDLEAFDAYPCDYDLIVLSDVLEHLDRPGKALDILLGQLAPGGCLMIVGPLPTSFKGLFTKLTPHGVHVWFYRTIIGESSAGEPGYPPFRTYLRWAISPGPLARLARARGLEVVHLGISGPSPYLVENMRQRSRVLAGAYFHLMWLLRTVSLGRWHPELSEMIVILRRPRTDPT